MKTGKVKPKQNQKGTALLMAILFLGVGSLGIGALFSYLNASFLSQAKAYDRTEGYYAAEAGIQLLTANLLQNSALDRYDANDDTDETNLVNVPWNGDSVNGYGGTGEPTITITITYIADHSSTGYKDYTVQSVASGTSINCELRQRAGWMGQTIVDVISSETVF